MTLTVTNNKEIVIRHLKALHEDGVKYIFLPDNYYNVYVNEFMSPQVLADYNRSGYPRCKLEHIRHSRLNRWVECVLYRGIPVIKTSLVEKLFPHYLEVNTFK